MIAAVDRHGQPAARRTGVANELCNAMSVDVEDYFQVSAMDGLCERARWDAMAGRVDRNVGRILELFADTGVRGSFFILGWVAERYPAMVRRIAAEGHEIASHGYEHRRVDRDTVEGFRNDVSRTKAILEDLTGASVAGYRAASFSIGRATPWAFDALQEAGYRYSSSTYPIRHDLYGDPRGRRFPYHPVAGSPFLEIPVSTLDLRGRRLPSGGGGYFRLLPLSYSLWAIRRLNGSERRPAIFYFHPWEIDPGQPRVAGLPTRTRIRHYTNLKRMHGKLGRVCREFDWDRMDRIFL